MSDFLVDKKVTQSQADKEMAPMELDLYALFKIMESNMIMTLEDFNGTPEEYIKNINSKLKKKTKVKKNIYKSEDVMPEPKTGESKEDYIKRCIPIIIKEGLTKEQAAGKCYGMWNSHTEKKSIILKTLTLLTNKLIKGIK